MLIHNLFPYMNADGAGMGETQGIPEAGEESLLSRDSVQEGVDERKTGMDVKSEAQQIADGIVRKRLKGIDRDELQLFRENKEEFFKYVNSKKTEAERIAEATRKATEALSAAQKREAKANAMIAAAGAGLKPEHIEDAVILAMARVDDDTTIEEAIKTIVKSNPNWIVGTNLPKTGGNPAEDEQEKRKPPILI